MSEGVDSIPDMNTTDARTTAARTANHLTTISEVHDLAARLNNPADMVPTLVVTTDQRTSQISLDMAELCRCVDDDVQVYVLESGPLTWEFTHSMPPETSVWGGAARIYPAHDLTWTQSPFAGDLLFTNIRAENATVLARIIAERVNTHAVNARGIEALATMAAKAEVPAAMIAPQPFRGKFTGASSASEGLITSPDAPNMNLLRIDLTALLPGAPVSIDSVFAVEDEVSGLFDTSGTVTEVDGMRTVEQMADDLAPQHAYPAVVSEIVGKSQVRVQVVPGVISTLTQRDIDTTVTVGDVVAVQVQSVGERDGKVRIVVGPAPEDVADEAVVNAAPALRTGGPSWVTITALAEDADAVTGTDSDENAAVGVPEGSVAELRGLRGRVPRLNDRVRQLEATIAALRRSLDTSDKESVHAWDEADRLDDENEQLRALFTSAGLSLPDELVTGGAQATSTNSVTTKKTVKRTVHTERPLIGTEFSTLEEQLRAEITVHWMRQVDAADKAGYQLNFEFGRDFLESVQTTINDAESVRQKLPQVMAWIACGMAERTTRHHAYRTSEGGGAPQLIRTDGAQAFRVDLETNTPAARRLHYWHLPNGTVEFARVGFHDEPGF